MHNADEGDVPRAVRYGRNMTRATRKWRRTAVELNGRLTPLRDDWSLYDPASDLEIALI